jgi:hypothetical protein
MAVPSSILVLGAGELGNAVLKSLSNHPLLSSSQTKIILLVREQTLSSPSPSKKKELDYFTSLNISFLSGDLTNDSQETLSQKFKDFEVVIGCTGMAAPPGTQVKIAKAVLQAGVKTYIPWQFGVDYDIIGRSSSQNLFTEQLDVRALLRAQSRTAWVIVSTGMFMSFLFEEAFGVVGKDRSVVRSLGDWGNSVTVTRVEDIGRMVAEVVFVPEDAGDGVVFIAGETISYRRLADVIEKVMEKEVEREEWSVQYLKEKLAETPEDGMRKYRVVFAEGKGVAWDMETTLNARRGIKLQGVEEWLRERLATGFHE